MGRTLERRRATADKQLPELRRMLTSALGDGRMVLASVQPSEWPATRPASTRPAGAQPATRPMLARLVAAATSRPATTEPAHVGTLPLIPPNISTKHAYAVLAYEAKTDAVTFWNPHGQTFHPKGSPGLTNGYPTDHGRFSVPLAEAHLFITFISIEQPAPATRPTTKPSTRP